ncbi:hypothetical protein FNV43_RR22201 [Rhamnella rubrinervis]|uniref:IBH1-like N-terminal domain-containing protein n=1 Tax=Rhamnella rubrinervis TaxID=2594499 RepID=A0A8K0GQV5_9ROSA|nr:hypothetical protein FNV43_RR22201 [Rhamnella rubrinervis]
MNNPRRLSSSCSMTNIKSRFTHGFLRALSRINTRKPSTTREICKRFLRVKLAADASMASAVGSRRAWSRAMLLKMRLRRRTCRDSRITNDKKKKKKMSGSDQKEEVNGIRKAEELRGLVPGGESMEICKLLDETAHYIKCLSTQVKVMTTIADFYSL